MIHYHGGPITPQEAAIACWQGRHAFVSFLNDQQIQLAAEICHSFAVDNGAYGMWRGNKVPVWSEYYNFVEKWKSHPGFDWAIIPDVIGGSEDENDALLDEWPFLDSGVPVWHLNESLERLDRLCTSFPRVALGSSGRWSTLGTRDWWYRIAQVMTICCDGMRPRVKLHGLRMLNVEIYRRLPLSSADSTNVARNIGYDSAWRGTYQPKNRTGRAMILTQRIESHNSASQWDGDIPEQQDFFLS